MKKTFLAFLMLALISQHNTNTISPAEFIGQLVAGLAMSAGIIVPGKALLKNHDTTPANGLRGLITLAVLASTTQLQGQRVTQATALGASAFALGLTLKEKHDEKVKSE